MRKRADIDDIESLEDSLFDREESARRSEAREERRRRAQQEADSDRKEAEERRVRIAREARLANGRLILRQYESAGVDPISLDVDGIPECSLSFLLSIGWTVEEIEGRMNLMAPNARTDPDQ